MDKVYLGNQLTSFYPGVESLPITRVELLNNEGDVVGVAGDNTGRTLTSTHPDGSNKMAASILAKVSGYRYRPFEGAGACLDPAAELGDGLTLGGVYSVLSKSSINFNKMYTGDVGAPTMDGVEDEYPYISQADRLTNRKFAKVYSSITKTAEQIRLEVKDEIDGVNASIDTSLNGIKLEFSKTYLTQTDAKNTYQTSAQVKAAIELSEQGIALNYLTKTDAKNTYQTETQVESAIQLGIEGIYLSVTNGNSSSTIKLMSGTTELSSKTIKFTGNVVFADDLTDGVTQISGSNITTGTISTTRLHVGGNISIYSSKTYSDDRTVKGYFGYYTGFTTGDDGSISQTEGVGIKHTDSTGQVNCSNAGIWCGYGQRSGLSAYYNGVTIKASKVVFSAPGGAIPTIDFTGCTVKGLSSSGGVGTFG